jgi:hypothetical protein
MLAMIQSGTSKLTLDLVSNLACALGVDRGRHLQPILGHELSATAW